MSQWTNMYAILRDLSEAQGSDVPVDIIEAVTDGDKPPTPTFKEETEEEFFGNCTGAGDMHIAPDFGLIRQMLDVVRVSTSLSVEVVDNSSASNEDVSTKINETKTDENTLKNVGKKINAKRKDRNAALESILNRIGKEIANENVGNDKRLNNTTLLESETSNQNVADKTNNSTPKGQSPANSRVLALEPINMFRKKSPTQKSNKESPKQVLEKSSNSVTYKPTERASEYYKKFVERARLQETMQDDIWTRAEKKMKEIEANKLLQAAQSSSKEETEIDRSN